jgi:RimJ/RimL family protein N-acetyltransferase
MGTGNGHAAELRLRHYATGDPPRVLRWYEADRKGFEAFMGTTLPDGVALTIAMTALLQAASNQQALFQMIDSGSETIGFTGLTNMTPDRSFGQPHLYIAPPYRRQSLAAAQFAERHAQELGVKHFLISVDTDNPRGLALAKRLHYVEVPRRTFLKELSQ